MRFSVLHHASCCAGSPAIRGLSGRNRKPRRNFRKPAESAPSKNAPDSGAPELPSGRGVRSREQTPPAPRPIPRFAARGARAVSGKVQLCWVEKIRRRIAPRRSTACALQTGGLHCKEPRLGTNPSATATPGFFADEFRACLRKQFQRAQRLSELAGGHGLVSLAFRFLVSHSQVLETQIAFVGSLLCFAAEIQFQIDFGEV